MASRTDLTRRTSAETRILNSCETLYLAMWLPLTHSGLLVDFAILYGSSGISILVTATATGQSIATEN